MGLKSAEVKSVAKTPSSAAKVSLKSAEIVTKPSIKIQQLQEENSDFEAYDSDEDYDSDEYEVVEVEITDSEDEGEEEEVLVPSPKPLRKPHSRPLEDAHRMDQDARPAPKTRLSLKQEDSVGVTIPVNVAEPKDTRPAPKKISIRPRNSIS